MLDVSMTLGLFSVVIVNFVHICASVLGMNVYRQKKIANIDNIIDEIKTINK